ncbi:hypothetical protein ACTA71_007439 [Dictyostelium dimigraforme]
MTSFCYFQLNQIRIFLEFFSFDAVEEKFSGKHLEWKPNIGFMENPRFEHPPHKVFLIKGSYEDRTHDLFLTREAQYHYAKEPFDNFLKSNQPQKENDSKPRKIQQELELTSHANYFTGSLPRIPNIRFILPNKSIENALPTFEYVFGSGTSLVLSFANS